MKTMLLAVLLAPALAFGGGRIVKTSDGFILPDGSRAVKTSAGYNIHAKGGGTLIVRKTSDGFSVYDTRAAIGLPRCGASVAPRTGRAD